MDMLKHVTTWIGSCIYIVCIFLKDIKALQVSINPNITAAIGISNIQLRCTFTFEENEKGDVIQLKARNRSVDNDFFQIAAFFRPPGRLDKPSLTTHGKYLDGRVALENPTTSWHVAVLTFNVVQCIDDNDYRCEIVYDITGELLTEKSSPTKLKIQSNSTKPDSITSTPSLSEVVDGQYVSFICHGNVGKPAGKFIWKKYQHNKPLPTIYSDIITVSHEVPENCTFLGTSNLTIQLTALDNRAIIECVEQSFESSQTMTVKIGPVNVYYKLRGIIVTKTPDLDTYQPGLIDHVNLTCHADGNPIPMYSWFREDNQETILSTENILGIKELTVNKSGNYVCRAYHNINGSIYSDTQVVRITIAETPLHSMPSEDSQIIVAVAVCVVLLIGILITVVVCYKVKCSKQKCNPQAVNFDHLDNQDRELNQHFQLAPVYATVIDEYKTEQCSNNFRAEKINQHIQLAPVYSTVKDEYKTEQCSNQFKVKESNHYAEVAMISNGKKFKHIRSQIKENEITYVEIFESD